MMLDLTTTLANANGMAPTVNTGKAAAAAAAAAEDSDEEVPEQLQYKVRTIRWLTFIIDDSNVLMLPCNSCITRVVANLQRATLQKA
eukprot:6196836-Pleurochrysis_carterae.AAC.2